MGSDDTMTGGNEEFVRQLRRLEPAGHTIDRDALMFRAGQRSAGRRLRLWQSLSGTVVLLAVGLWWLGFGFPRPALRGGARLQPSQAAGDRDAAREHARPTGSMATASGLTDQRLAGRLAGQGQPPDGAYLELRRRVTLEGLDALPSSGTSPACPDTVQTIADWLRLPPAADLGSDPFAFSVAATKGKPS